jgi:hypothetical protein
MIKLTYEHICDSCKAHLETEVYECSNYPTLEFPKPHRKFSFDLSVLHAQLCKDCAMPVYKAIEQMKEKIIQERNKL